MRFFSNIAKKASQKSLGRDVRKREVTRAVISLEALEPRTYYAGRPLDYITYGLNGTSIVDTLNYGKVGIPNTAQKLNGDFQIAATVASFASMANPIAAGATFSIAGGAWSASMAAMAADLQEGNKLDALGDVISSLGDLTLMASSMIAQVPGTQLLADRVAVWGDALTVAGMLVTHAGPISAQLASEGNAEDAFLEGQAASPSSNASPLGTAMGEISYELANDSHALGTAIADVASQSFSTDLNNLTTAVNDTETTLASFVHNSHFGTPTVTDAVVGDTASLTSSDNSLNGTTGTLRSTANNGSLNLAATSLSNGNTEQTVANFNDAGGNITETAPSSGAVIIYLDNVAQNLQPANSTPGAKQSAGSTVTYFDKNDGLVHSATVLCQSSNGDYVINGATESGSTITVNAPILLDGSVTVLGVAPPTGQSGGGETLNTINDASGGSETGTTIGIKHSKVTFTESDATNSAGQTNTTYRRDRRHGRYQ